ncbi:MAG: NADH-quinone oxidoreductase subunit J [Elusimicrobia bacterium]|nr:NADH-quinone oxidoreductase subunit J [Elusimicrobiota bacterium]
MEQFAFYVFAGVTLLAALGVVLLRNVLHAALMLGLCLLGVAGIFAQLGADFLFASQILIYVGGIAVLILFVVLLAGRASELITRQTNKLWPPAAFVCGVTFVFLLRYYRSFNGTSASSAPKPTTFALGKLLLGDLALPFELISLILLAALAGAIVFSRTEHDEEERKA